MFAIEPVVSRIVPVSATVVVVTSGIDVVAVVYILHAAGFAAEPEPLPPERIGIGYTY
jgi:hypothetical protein